MLRPVRVVTRWPVCQLFITPQSEGGRARLNLITTTDPEEVDQPLALTA